MLVSKRVSLDDFAHILSARLNGQVGAVRRRESRDDYEILETEWTFEGKNQPLTIHSYDTQRSLEAGRIEAHTLETFAQQGFPAPRPLLFVEDSTVAGAPFLVMECPRIERLADLLARTPQALPDWIDEIASVLSRLHRIPLFDWAASQRLLDFAERRVKQWRTVAAAHQDQRAEEGFSWLHDNYHRLRPVTMRSLIHHSFSPDNIIVDEYAITAVTGWCRLSVADPALDVGWMRMLLTTRYGHAQGDAFLAAYTRRIPEIESSLAYWEVYAAAKQLALLSREGKTGFGADFGQAVYDFMKVRLIEEV